MVFVMGAHRLPSLFLGPEYLNPLHGGGAVIALLFAMLVALFPCSLTRCLLTRATGRW